MEHLRRAIDSVGRHEQAVAVGLGPHGLDQLILDEANQPTISNSGDVILSARCPDDALGALLLKLVTDSCAALGDGSKRLLLMVLAGLRQFLRSGLHPHAFQAALAAQVLQCVVPAAVLHVPLAPGHEGAAAEALHALISTHLGGKLGGPAASAHLAACLKDLVLMQLAAASRAGLSAAEALSSLASQPPLFRLPSSCPHLSRLLPGVLLGEGPLSGGMAAGAASELRSPIFLALSCPLDGEPLSCVSTAPTLLLPGGGSSGNCKDSNRDSSRHDTHDTPPTTNNNHNKGSSGRDNHDTPTTTHGGCGGGGGLAALQAAQLELLRQRVELLAERGVTLLLLAGRPPAGAVQLCQQYGICLVAGLDEQDLARACAASAASTSAAGGGGTAPLTRAGLAALRTAPLGRAVAARVVGMGPRRGLLLEFDQEAAMGQAACTLLLCGTTEVAVRQAARAVQRCLISLAAAVGSMARPRPRPHPHPRSGHPRLQPQPQQQEGDEEEEAGDEQQEEEEEVECLVFVAGGGGFEGLLEGQLRELEGVALRGRPARGEGGEEEPRGQEEEEEEDVGRAAAAEAAAVSQLVGSLRVLHAMAAAVPVALTGATPAAAAPVTTATTTTVAAVTTVAAAACGGDGGGGGGDGGGGSRGAGGLSGASLAAVRRGQREALLQVHALRQAQLHALSRGQVSRAGLVVPSAALSSAGHQGRGNPMRHLRSGEDAAAAAGDTAAAGVAAGGVAAAAGVLPSTATGTAAGTAPAAAAAAAGGCNSNSSSSRCSSSSSFAVCDAVSCGVVEAAAVVSSLWSAAVEVLGQVLRIDGAALSATRRPTGRQQLQGGLAAAGGLQLAGPAPVAVPRVRRGGGGRGGKRQRQGRQAVGAGGGLSTSDGSDGEEDEGDGSGDSDW
ncbi:hypothetical protein Agub_g12873 [Astrephomene gubernaculifera]|uniref:Uncharacterized protein n=1 Tax=Astrephomene gubernaculifera TaxID=47775 RepID=A0AAD3HRM3_9CHLO|nr:hypothetical protein Agub_g12873 [Astrephomene gubernaculifera]